MTRSKKQTGSAPEAKQPGFSRTRRPNVGGKVTAPNLNLNAGPLNGGGPVLSKDSQRNATAYHEAGHAVVAYMVGWRVNHEGVEIDRRQYTGMRYPVCEDRPSSIAIVFCAGWLSENRWHGRGGRLLDDEDLLYCIGVARGHEIGEGGADNEEIFKAFLKEFPDKSDQWLSELYREYECQCWDVFISDPTVWRAIESVAELLVKKGAITANEVETLLPE
jgi:hypothetical protein